MTPAPANPQPPASAMPAKVWGTIYGNNLKRRAYKSGYGKGPESEPWYTDDQGTQWSAFDVRFVEDDAPTQQPAVPVAPLPTEAWSLELAAELLAPLHSAIYQPPKESVELVAKKLASHLAAVSRARVEELKQEIDEHVKLSNETCASYQDDITQLRREADERGAECDRLTADREKLAAELAEMKKTLAQSHNAAVDAQRSLGAQLTTANAALAAEQQKLLAERVAHNETANKCDALFDYIHETENANSGWGLVQAKEKLKQRLGLTELPR